MPTQKAIQYSIVVPITCNNIQQGVQMDTTYNIQQFWELLSTELEQVVHTH